MKRENQRSVYADPDVLKEWEKFVSRYPLASLSNVFNVAMRDYFARCVNGVDGNLLPLNKPKEK